MSGPAGTHADEQEYVALQRRRARADPADRHFIDTPVNRIGAREERAHKAERECERLVGEVERGMAGGETAASSQAQVRRINDIVRQIDRGRVESRAIREFLRRRDLA